MVYIMVKFQIPNYNAFRELFSSVIFGPAKTDRKQGSNWTSGKLAEMCSFNKYTPLKVPLYIINLNFIITWHNAALKRF